jgi:hypothetical protein
LKPVISLKLNFLEPTKSTGAAPDMSISLTIPMPETVTGIAVPSAFVAATVSL